MGGANPLCAGRRHECLRIWRKSPDASARTGCDYQIPQHCLPTRHPVRQTQRNHHATFFILKRCLRVAAASPSAGQGLSRRRVTGK